MKSLLCRSVNSNTQRTLNNVVICTFWTHVICRHIHIAYARLWNSQFVFTILNFGANEFQSIRNTTKWVYFRFWVWKDLFEDRQIIWRKYSSTGYFNVKYSNSIRYVHSQLSALFAAIKFHRNSSCVNKLERQSIM